MSATLPAANDPLPLTAQVESRDFSVVLVGVRPHLMLIRIAWRENERSREPVNGAYQ